LSITGYSGSPLSKKLGIVEGSRVTIVDDPGHATALLDPLPAGVSFVSKPATADVVVFFATTRRRFEHRLPAFAEAIRPDRALWIAWPKQSSGVVTDMTEGTIRDVALPLGLVDNKVCAVDETWSALRLVWRREHR